MSGMDDPRGNHGPDETASHPQLHQLPPHQPMSREEAIKNVVAEMAGMYHDAGNLFSGGVNYPMALNLIQGSIDLFLLLERGGVDLGPLTCQIKFNMYILYVSILSVLMEWSRICTVCECLIKIAADGVQKLQVMSHWLSALSNDNRWTELEQIAIEARSILEISIKDGMLDNVNTLTDLIEKSLTKAKRKQKEMSNEWLTDQQKNQERLQSKQKQYHESFKKRNTKKGGKFKIIPHKEDTEQCDTKGKPAVKSAQRDGPAPQLTHNADVSEKNSRLDISAGSSEYDSCLSGVEDDSSAVEYNTASSSLQSSPKAPKESSENPMQLTDFQKNFNWDTTGAKPKSWKAQLPKQEDHNLPKPETENTGESYRRKTNISLNLDSSDVDTMSRASSVQSLYESTTQKKKRKRKRKQKNNDQEHDQNAINTLQFPIPNSSFKLVCNKCIYPARTDRKGEYRLVVYPNHHCPEDLLIVKRSSTWNVIRERKHLTSFSGNHVLCRHFTATPQLSCGVMGRQCRFPHSKEEKILWDREKEGTFSISDFIKDNKSNQKRPVGVDYTSFVQQFPGSFQFDEKGELIHILIKGNSTTDSSSPLTAVVNKINPKGSDSSLCPNLRLCLDENCKKAHSEVERAFWKLQKETGSSQQDLVSLLGDLCAEDVPLLKSKLFQIQRSAQQEKSKTNAKLDSESRNRSHKTSPCPYMVTFICGQCHQLKPGIQMSQDQSKTRCSNKQLTHDCKSSRIAVITDDGKRIKQIKELPEIARSNISFKPKLCENMAKHGQCNTWKKGKTCTYAHSEEEGRIWEWQAKNKVFTLDGLVENSTNVRSQVRNDIANNEPRAGSRNIHSDNAKCQAMPVTSQPKGGQPPVSSSHPVMPLSCPVSLDMYCALCDVWCNGPLQLQEHCLSKKHQLQLTMDTEQWQWRKPPCASLEYKMCKEHLTSRCKYSMVIQENNFCPFAHDKDELEEWKERKSISHRKQQFAKKKGLITYAEEVLHKLELADNRSTVMTEELDNVDVKCNKEFLLQLHEKNTTCSWIFNIKLLEGLHLKKAFLLNNRHRVYFNIGGVNSLASGQILDASVLSTSIENEYEIEVNFSGSKVFGSYSQDLLLDFGVLPYLVCHLQVDVGTLLEQEEVANLKKKLHLEHWTESKVEIVSYENKELKQTPLSKYKLPKDGANVVDYDFIKNELTARNYADRMHKLLYIEEVEQLKLVDNYNMVETLETVLQAVNPDEGIFLVARPGCLLARIPMVNQLSNDFPAGKLILRNSTHVLIGAIEWPKESKRKVFEAQIVMLENYGVDGRGKDYIYVTLSPMFVNKYQLQDGSKIEVEIQFQLNRIPICEMHSAVDNLEHSKNLHLVFPEPPADEKQLYSLESEDINENQKKAILAILHQPEKNGPLIIAGPFGTGKTRTLAKSVMLLTSQRKRSRILLCTHSNSAADLYITEHFDDYNEHLHKNCQSKIRICRIYFQGRRLHTVPDQVQKYCNIIEDTFVIPTSEEIRQHQVVIVTTNMAHQLRRLDLQGAFSHIFIDEAGQALESEAITPLCLAAPDTCVVLAGDHKQMSPDVFGQEARKYNLHISLLERLFIHYQQQALKKQPKGEEVTIIPNVILLNQNYRAEPTILKFLSKVFYAGIDSLKCCRPCHHSAMVDMPSLCFWRSDGKETQDVNATSYYNTSEVVQVVEVVKWVLDRWPAEWGDKNPSRIAVTTAYPLQVKKIRDALRHAKLRDVTVESVFNIQGKEFQAIIISTVRTQHGTEWRPGNKDMDLGFLTDEKLLNTAFTRAREFVGVVGDPIGLCAIGQCQMIWKEFLTCCAADSDPLWKNCYLLPPELTVEQINMEVAQLSMELSRRSQNENSLKTIVKTNAEMTINQKKEKTVHVSNSQGDIPVPKAQIKSTKNEKLSVLDERDMGSSQRKWRNMYESEEKKETDLILKYLVMQSQESEKTKENAVEHDAHPEPAEDNYFNIRCLKFEEEGSFATFHYNPRKRLVDKKERKRLRNRVSAKDAEKGYSSGSEESEDDELEDEDEKEDLLELTRTAPWKYKRCVMNITHIQSMYAHVLDDNTDIKEIFISSQRHRGRSFDKDHVVVEIIGDTDDGEGRPKGKVLGILKRHIIMRYKKLVCMADPENPSLMIPRKTGMPKIHNLMKKDDETAKNNARRGFVRVYRFTKDRTPLQVKDVPLEYENSERQLFLVRYLHWRKGFAFPLGIVIEELPVGDGKDTGMHILNVEHNVPKIYNDHHPLVQDLKKTYPQTFTLPQSVVKRKKDLREKTDLFTIDNAESMDLDDALSIESRVSANKWEYLVGVHIADASHFVEKGSSLDKDAFKRATSFYPKGSPAIPMLPSILSANRCSLLRRQDRLAISVFFRISVKGEITEYYDPVETIVASSHKLSKTEVEGFLEAPVHFDEQDDIDLRMLNTKLRLLYQMAKGLKKKRIGEDGYLDCTKDDEENDTPKAHTLVEEFMLLTNQRIAEYLLKEYPNCTPLRRQLPPNERDTEAWREQYGNQCNTSFALHRAKKLCKCRDACKCGSREYGTESIEAFILFEKVWKQILVAQNIDDLIQIVGNANLHPQQAQALIAWYRIQTKAEYVCSGTNESEFSHFSLKMRAYTHFTSPIRRYIDLVVHRMVKSALREKPCPYTKEEIEEICIHCTEMSARADKYERETMALDFALKLQESPQTKYPTVSDIENQFMELLFPSVKAIPSRCGKLKYALLELGKQPCLDEAHTVELTWIKRVYDMIFTLKDVQQSGKQICNVNTINDDRFVVKVPMQHWRLLLRDLQDGDWDMAKKRIQKMKVDIEKQGTSAFTNTSSESLPGNRGDIYKNHYCTFQRKYAISQVIKVQLATTIYRGLLTPKVQLLNTAPTFDVCVQHREEPLVCFSKQLPNPLCARPRHIEQYRTQWLDTQVMESAYCTVEEREGAIIHNVQIEWEMCEDEVVHGRFLLSRTECKRRHLDFSQDVIEPLNTVKIKSNWMQKFHRHLRQGECPGIKITPFGFLCVRIKECHFQYGSQLGKEAQWVGHCHITDVKVSTEEDKVALMLKLHHPSVDFPEQLLDQPKEKLPLCSVEWLKKPTPDVRVENALIGLSGESTSNFIQRIALGTIKPAAVGSFAKAFSTEVPFLFTPNQSQHDAISTARFHDFTLIQGPPGTGKSVTGSRLAYLFVQMNRFIHAEHHIDKQEKVLYCGPSNKAVDVIVNNLQKSDAKIVRMYSKKVETADYPLPWLPMSAQHNRNPLDTNLRDQHRHIVLHHMIRDKSRKSGKEICDYDQMFKTSPQFVTDEIIRKYQKLVTKAKNSILENSEVILTTCSVSGGPRLKEMNIKQVIIDECGMCKEPETLVPLVACNPKQVVLIGDHKQLQPIIRCPAAKRAGLDISMFQRYAKEYQGSTIMLKKQYRMHQAICEFPSKMFYNGELITASGQSHQNLISPSRLRIWPGGQTQPLAFCHLEGKEEILSAGTVDGGIGSCSNKEEVEKVTDVVKKLVKRHHIAQNKIAVLSQYRAQCNSIMENLKQQNLNDVHVGTVITAQGDEWDYVLLSTVRSLPKKEIEQTPWPGWCRTHLGFITDEHQINVAITRARFGLIIVGNQHLLRCDRMWRELLQHYENVGALVDASRFMPD